MDGLSFFVAIAVGACRKKPFVSICDTAFVSRTSFKSAQKEGPGGGRPKRASRVLVSIVNERRPSHSSRTAGLSQQLQKHSFRPAGL
jgi:hypothetical protein